MKSQISNSSKPTLFSDSFIVSSMYRSINFWWIDLLKVNVYNNKVQSWQLSPLFLCPGSWKCRTHLSKNVPVIRLWDTPAGPMKWINLYVSIRAPQKKKKKACFIQEAADNGYKWWWQRRRRTKITKTKDVKCWLKLTKDSFFFCPPLWTLYQINNNGTKFLVISCTSIMDW